MTQRIPRRDRSFEQVAESILNPVPIIKFVPVRSLTITQIVPIYDQKETGFAVAYSFAAAVEALRKAKGKE